MVVSTLASLTVPMRAAAITLAAKLSMGGADGLDEEVAGVAVIDPRGGPGGVAGALFAKLVDGPARVAFSLEIHAHERLGADLTAEVEILRGADLVRFDAAPDEVVHRLALGARADGFAPPVIGAEDPPQRSIGDANSRVAAMRSGRQRFCMWSQLASTEPSVVSSGSMNCM